ncbi:MAG: 5-oxoprolinase subunit PxpB [Colwellia sp.]
MSIDGIKIQVAGENALIIYFAEQTSAEVAAKVQQAEQLIRQNMGDDLVDLVLSYASILVVFDLFKTDHHHVRKTLRHILNTLPHLATHDVKSTLVELPVYYSLESGPDLNIIAQRAKLSVEDVIKIHQAQVYRVYAIGFAPGFAYLGEVDQRIAVPRLSSPRLKVPKGAVAIADRQTAVYPSISPGGWNIIGLCPIDMFNANATPTMPVQVGDQVKFTSISKGEFLALGGLLSDLLDDSLSESI